MSGEFDSTDRSPLELFLFALGFFGFINADAGIVLAAPALALFGAAVFLVALLGLKCCGGPRN